MDKISISPFFDVEPNIHNKVRTKPHDEKGLENLSQYIIRNAFSLEKMHYLKETGKVLYRPRCFMGI